MRMIVLACIAFGLTACQPQQVNQAAQQQHFICKSLIEGFLKTQKLGEYQLNHLQPTLHQTEAKREYTYQASADHSMKINMPSQQNLKFECLQKTAEEQTENRFVQLPHGPLCHGTE